MKAVVNIARAGCALIALSIACSVGVAAAPVSKAPQMTLVGTDTVDLYPFAAIAVGNQTYHVTEGDSLDGVYIRRIDRDRVTLSGNQVLVAGQPLRPEIARAQIARANVRSL